MGLLLSTLIVVISGILALQIGHQFRHKRHPYQIVWSFSMMLFAIGAVCQWVATLAGWNPTIYRLWYLTGAILTAAYLGQGTVYLQARRNVAHFTMAVLVVASVVASIMVFQAPVDLEIAQANEAISGHGMPHAVRLLTPFFNIFGTVTLVGGALRSTAYFLWHGYGDKRALGTSLIAIGAIVVAAGGTLARFQIPQPLYISELIGVFLILVGFRFSNYPILHSEISSADLRRRRKRLLSVGVGAGVIGIFGAISTLPVLPWTMNIVKDVIHVYTENVPEKNKGVYLTTTDGVMQLYTWHIAPDTFPEDAPTLASKSIHNIVVVYKQFESPEQYQLYEVNSQKHIDWGASQQDGMHLILTLTSPLSPGDYMLIIPTDSMFGGHTTHYFHVT